MNIIACLGMARLNWLISGARSRCPSLKTIGHSTGSKLQPTAHSSQSRFFARRTNNRTGPQRGLRLRPSGKRVGVVPFRAGDITHGRHDAWRVHSDVLRRRWRRQDHLPLHTAFRVTGCQRCTRCVRACVSATSTRRTLRRRPRAHVHASARILLIHCQPASRLRWPPRDVPAPQDLRRAAEGQQVQIVS
jgi:hypothetical protein